jgi:hypothetical protein
MMTNSDELLKSSLPKAPFELTEELRGIPEKQLAAYSHTKKIWINARAWAFTGVGATEDEDFFLPVAALPKDIVTSVYTGIEIPDEALSFSDQVTLYYGAPTGFSGTAAIKISVWSLEDGDTTAALSGPIEDTITLTPLANKLKITVFTLLQTLSAKKKLGIIRVERAGNTDTGDDDFWIYGVSLAYSAERFPQI